MDISFSPTDTTFRQQIRDFFANNYPQDLLAKIRSGQVLEKADHIASQKALQSRGWFAANWLAEYGGPGWDAKQRYIFEEELDRAGALNVIPMAVIYVGPVIYTFGNDEQKGCWLPDILESRAFWAQGYSEPESGSDLASLRTRADRDGDHYIVNGEKIWTSYAQWADWIFCLVRTSQEERKQAGISFLCFEMNSPGVTVTPIISIDGQHHLNRVTFENVRVPVNNRIGEEGNGWHYAQFLLGNERLSYAHVSRKRVQLQHLRALAKQVPASGERSMAEDAFFTCRLAACEVEIDVLEAVVLRALCAGAKATVATASTVKILSTELSQRITELYMELAGQNALPWILERNSPAWTDAIPGVPAFGPLAAAEYFFERAQTIYGGSTEIQKNILARELMRRAG